MYTDEHRRIFLKTTTQCAMAAIGFPNIIRASDRKPALRVLGTHVTLQETIRKKAQEDLGINIEFHPGGSAEVLLKASTEPDSFDIYEQWSNSIKILWNAGTIQPLETSRLTYWNEINDLTKTGRISPHAKIGAGDAPHKMLYVQEEGTLGSHQTDRVSFMPYVHNADSFGYNSRIIPRGEPYRTESWAWLLDERYRGKVGIVNAPTIGIFDLALAVQAKGLMRFNNIGNMSRKEIDTLFKIVIDYKRQGHFRGVWSSVPHSVALMQRGDVDIESMFSPGVSSLNGKGIPCIYAAPKEGYRAWHGVMCLSRNSRGKRKEAAYAFMNWWLSGWAGAFIARQGYYIANPGRAKLHMSQNEWDYWYMGRPAAEDLPGTDGRISVKKGMLRRGGSYVKRFENIAVWNSVMDNYEYTLVKWNEFVLA